MHQFFFNPYLIASLTTSRPIIRERVCIKNIQVVCHILLKVRLTFIKLVKQHVDMRSVAGDSIQPFRAQSFAFNELYALFHEERHAVCTLTTTKRQMWGIAHALISSQYLHFPASFSNNYILLDTAHNRSLPYTLPSKRETLKEGTN